MTQNEIAKASSLAQSYIHYIIKGDRVPSVNNAIKLEQATGICREAWIFPERHWNPYIPFCSTENCGNCQNQIHRASYINKTVVNHFRKSEDKRKGAKEILKIPRVINGFGETEVLSIREIVGNEVRLISFSGDEKTILPDVWEPDQRFRKVIHLLKTTRFVYFNVLEMNSDEYIYLYKHGKSSGLKAVYLFSSMRHLVLSFLSKTRLNPLSQSVIDSGVELIADLDDIWHNEFYA